MRKAKLVTAGGLLAFVLAAACVSPAFAWHPKGQIKKYVQNVTQGGSMQDADSAATAVSAKPGDTLLYTVVVSDVAAPASGADNDMYFTKMADSLPGGVQLASGATSADIGTIPASKSVTKQFRVKVTTTTNGAMLDNKACFTGNSKVNDNPQSGCDHAWVIVKVPPVYSCDALSLTAGDNRMVTAKVAYTAASGATYKSAMFDFGDSSSAVSGASTTATHTYAKDGTYTVTAKLMMDVNGTTQTVTGAKCSAPVTVKTPETPTPPTTPPVTPPATVTKCALDSSLPADSPKCTPCQYNTQILASNANCKAPAKPSKVTVLPNTGPGAIVAIAVLAIGIGAYFFNQHRLHAKQGPTSMR